MRALRFGSYSIGRDLRGHAVLVAPEVDDAVLLLVTAARGAATSCGRTRCGRPSWASSFVSDFSGRSRVISAKSETVWNRRPGLVGLRLRIGIAQLPKISIVSPSARETIARFWPARCP